MGSFSYTCALSHLGISAGTEVKYLLLSQYPFSDGCSIHGTWMPRTLPITAKYDDYGSIDRVQDMGLTENWLEGLEIDLIERGAGDNIYHDPAFMKGMSFEDLLSNLHSNMTVDAEKGRNAGRRNPNLWVRDYEDKKKGFDRKSIFAKRDEELIAEEEEKTEKNRAVPTWKKVVKILRKNGFCHYGDPNPDNLPTFLADQQSLGRVRLRSTEFGKQQDILKTMLPTLQQFACVLTLGSGRYADQHEIILFPHPDAKDFRLPDDPAVQSTEKSLRELKVDGWMVRKDIWDSLCALQFPEQYDWEPGVYTSKKVTISIDSQRAKIAKWWDKLTKASSQPSHSMVDHNFYEIFSQAPIGPNVPLGLGVRHSIRLFHNKWVDGFVDEALKDKFLESMAEFGMVEFCMAMGRKMWYPSTSAGPQEPEWEFHKKISDVIAGIAYCEYKKELDEKATRGW